MIIYSLTVNHFTCNRSASAVLCARKFKIEHQSLITDKTRMICLRRHFGTFHVETPTVLTAGGGWGLGNELIHV